MQQNHESKNPVVKHVLANGMTVLVREMHNLPQVSTQLWYNVGSRDEKDKERGIAHLIEHMVFKGTKVLSESDINVLTHMLSGSTNAFTSYDFTGYLFNMPSHHWKEVMPVMADCMQNVAFKEDMLSSEMKAVIQELKMYRDRYVRSLIDEMIGTIFSDHPYHYPIIGYKQDLWNVHADDLHAFYKKHYKPNNATLVVVGDVKAEEVFELAQKYFGGIASDPLYKKENFYHNKDIVAKSVVLYRDVQQPVLIYAYVVPGIKDKQDNLLELLAWVLGKGKSSRLHKKLVDEFHLATSASASTEELFDHGLFFVVVEPKNQKDIEKIKQVVQAEIDDIINTGVSEQELSRAIKQTEMGLFDLLEDTEHQAFEIGKYFLGTGDENYVFNYLSKPHEELKKGVQDIAARYLRAPVMHSGMILSLDEKDKPMWSEIQTHSDEEDTKILSARIRNTPVEPASYATKLEVKEPQGFDFPKATVSTLANGIKLLSYHTDNTPKIDLILDLKVNSNYDPQDKQGLAQFVAKMLPEGTKNYTSEQLAHEIESRGMSLDTQAGAISLSMLSQDLPFGLQIVNELITQATFPEKEVEKVRAQIESQLKYFWDEPRYFAAQLVRENIYSGHPYSKNAMGTFDSIKAIKQKDLTDFYAHYTSPRGARLSIVGDLTGHDVKQLVEANLGSWKGQEIADIQWPSLSDAPAKVVDYPINRDQVVLRFAAKSIDRKHPDYDKLLLFDQIFGGGVLGSMSSRLFELREQSGLFYGISGSLIAGANEQPGMAMVGTIVSRDRLGEAEKVIKETIDTAANTITQQEFDEARRAIVNSLISNFSSNYSIANAFLFIDKYNLPVDFFDKRNQTLAHITIKDMQDAVKGILNSERMILVRAGRLDESKRKVIPA